MNVKFRQCTFIGTLVFVLFGIIINENEIKMKMKFSFLFHFHTIKYSNAKFGGQGEKNIYSITDIDTCKPNVCKKQYRKNRRYIIGGYTGRCLWSDTLS